MKFNGIAIIGYVGLAVLLSSCSFVSQQLADKRLEEQLLKPGALDSDVATNFDEYRFRFLDKYQISHAWPVTSTCKYAGLRTRYKMGDTSYGDVYLIKDIYEEGSITKQREADPSWNFDRFVRSHKVQRPVSQVVDGVIVASKNPRYEEREEGLQPICFEAWVRTSQSLTLRLVKLSLDERIAHYSKRPSQRTRETVGSQTWHVWKYGLERDNPKAYGGEVWLTTIADTGYTLALELGEGLGLDKFPQARIEMRTLFRHLIESVKIEPLTPAIEAELTQLKAQAEEITRQNCIGMAKRTKPPAWCQKYLDP